MQVRYESVLIKKLNSDIEKFFSHIMKIDESMVTTHDGVSRLVMLDRYAQKDINLISHSEEDLVLVIVKDDPKFPVRGIGRILSINKDEGFATILLEDEYRGSLIETEEFNTGIIKRKLDSIDKPLEIFYEQIAKRVAYNLAQNEKSEESRRFFGNQFYQELKNLYFH